MQCTTYTATYMTVITWGLLVFGYPFPDYCSSACVETQLKYHYLVTPYINLIFERPPCHSSLTLYSCIHSFNKFVLSTYYVPGTILGSGETTVIMKRSLLSWGLYFQKINKNKQTNQINSNKCYKENENRAITLRMPRQGLEDS